MSRDCASASPEVPGIDLNFRPASYFWPLSLPTHLLARIKGAGRRAFARHLIEDGGLDRIPEILARSALTDGERRAVGQVHPAFMGGEYLPDMSAREVEIARITIASVTQDVTSVCARRGKRRIYYRVVDEYNGETLSAKCTRTSLHPLTLREVEAFLNSAWSIVAVLALNFPDDECPSEDMLAFVTSVESQFYPQIGELYEERIRAWGLARRAPTQYHKNANGHST